MYPIAHMGIPLLLPLIDERFDLDLRILTLGAILPDLIDKPLGHLLLPENNGRIYAHSLVLLILLAVLSIKFRKVIPLTIGVGFHQLLDMMFLDPRTTLWPLLGNFETTEFSTRVWIDHLYRPSVIAGELIGMVIIVIFILRFRLYLSERFIKFIRTGRILPGWRR